MLAQLLRAQQELIDLLPDVVEVTVLSKDRLRLSTSIPGRAHPNHTHILVELRVSVDWRNGSEMKDALLFNVVKVKRRQVVRLGEYVVVDTMHKLVKENLWHLGV